MRRRDALKVFLSTPALAADFGSSWSTDQTWLGPEYWANRLQDWRVAGGRIECVTGGGDRNVALLTHELSSRAQPFETRVKLGKIAGTQGYAGFRVGMKGPFHDYRDTAIYGIGLDCGITADGRLFLGDPEPASSPAQSLDNLELVLRAEPQGSTFMLTLSGGGRTITRTGVSPDWLIGGLALVCSSNEVAPTPNPAANVMTLSGINRRGRETHGDLRFHFRDWKITGPKVDAHPDRAWGPILFTMHTLSRNVLKLTAQFAPIRTEGAKAEFQMRRNGQWITAATSAIERLSRTATFKLRWDDRADTPYRVLYHDTRAHTYAGTIRRNPDKDRIVTGLLSCINDYGFPHAPIVRNLQHFKPDVLLFVGDQIYERSASYGIERLPIERAVLDYLRKWYLHGWAFGDLMRDTPSVCMPDDHDVYHGNVWGAGGKKADGFGDPGQDSGGYVEPAEWVNMVQRTQTSHLPDPFDPTPVQQNIGVYYTDFLYGGVSYAIIEDRKWKSAPKVLLPKAEIVNGWAQNPEYNAARDGDVPGAQLLGPRQISFLKHWAQDWQGAWMKVFVSQTVFANVATLPPPANTDAVTPKLPILKPGEYSEGELHVADHDSNGWPQTPRNEALRVVRRALAVHLTGDQHLGSTTQYGIENWNDGPWSICSPAVSNLFPRRWYPADRGRNQMAGAPRNTGEYLDGFGNKVTVHAVFNPEQRPGASEGVNVRATGYSIIEFDRTNQTSTLTNWPRWIDASAPGAKPCAGWPIVVKQEDNGLPKTGLKLPPVSNLKKGSLIEVRHSGSHEHVYTYRAVSSSFAPPVWTKGEYDVIVRDPAGNVVRRSTHSV